MLLSTNSSQADGKHFVLAVMNSTRLCRPVLEHLFSGCSLKNGNTKNRSKYSSFEWRTTNKSVTDGYQFDKTLSSFSGSPLSPIY